MTGCQILPIRTTSQRSYLVCPCSSRSKVLTFARRVLRGAAHPGPEGRRLELYRLHKAVREVPQCGAPRRSVLSVTLAERVGGHSRARMAREPADRRQTAAPQVLSASALAVLTECRVWILGHVPFGVVANQGPKVLVSDANPAFTAVFDRLVTEVEAALRGWCNMSSTATLCRHASLATPTRTNLS